VTSTGEPPTVTPFTAVCAAWASVQPGSTPPLAGM
jgi:hypothetical protein